MRSKKIAEKMLSDVDEDLSFNFSNGERASNLRQLFSKIVASDSGTFSHHVNAQRHDFSTWIKDVFENKTLASTLVSKRTKENFVDCLRDELIHLENAIKPKKQNNSHLDNVSKNILSSEESKNIHTNTSNDNHSKKNVSNSNMESVAELAKKIQTPNLPKSALDIEIKIPNNIQVKKSNIDSNNKVFGRPSQAPQFKQRKNQENISKIAQNLEELNQNFRENDPNKLDNVVKKASKNISIPKLNESNDDKLEKQLKDIKEAERIAFKILNSGSSSRISQSNDENHSKVGSADEMLEFAQDIGLKDTLKNDFSKIFNKSTIKTISNDMKNIFSIDKFKRKEKISFSSNMLRDSKKKEMLSNLKRTYD